MDWVEIKSALNIYARFLAFKTLQQPEHTLMRMTESIFVTCNLVLILSSCGERQEHSVTALIIKPLLFEINPRPNLIRNYNNL